MHFEVVSAFQIDWDLSTTKNGGRGPTIVLPPLPSLEDDTDTGGLRSVVILVLDGVGVGAQQVVVSKSSHYLR